VAWSRLQSASATSAASVGSIGATYSTANLTSGTKLIALSAVTGTTTSTVKDGAGNSWTKILAVLMNGSATNGELSLWALDTPAGDAGTKPTLTATFAGTSVFGQSLVIQEISGLATGSTVAAMIDGTAASNNGTTASGALASPSYSSSTANEYLIACYGDDAAVNPVTWTVPSGFTADANAVNGSNAADDALSFKNSTGGSESGGYTVNQTGNHYAQILCAFKLSGGGGGGVSGTVQRRATVPVPRRKPARALWQRVTGQAFVKVPAPAQQPRPAPRRTLARAVWRGITGPAYVAVPAPRQQPGPAPRRRMARAVWQHVTGQAFAKVPAPRQQPSPAPRRKPARAYIRFTPVATANAVPATPVNGTVQPRATVTARSRRPARAYIASTVRTAATAAAPSGSVQSRATLVSIRRRPSRALIPVPFVPLAPAVPAGTEGGAVYYPYHHRGRGRTR
jgi:hypothetical protein